MDVYLQTLRERYMNMFQLQTLFMYILSFNIFLTVTLFSKDYNKMSKSYRQLDMY